MWVKNVIESWKAINSLILWVNNTLQKLLIAFSCQLDPLNHIAPHNYVILAYSIIISTFHVLQPEITHITFATPITLLITWKILGFLISVNIWKYSNWKIRSLVSVFLLPIFIYESRSFIQFQYSWMKYVVIIVTLT